MSDILYFPTKVIPFQNLFQPGHGRLSLTFTGILNDKMKGFYRSKYTSPDGEERYSAVTQFEVGLTKTTFILLSKTKMQDGTCSVFTLTHLPEARDK
jgi:hypothetical protein